METGKLDTTELARWRLSGMCVKNVVVSRSETECGCAVCCCNAGTVEIVTQLDGGCVSESFRVSGTRIHVMIKRVA